MGFELDVRDAFGLTNAVLAYLGYGSRVSIEDFPREYEADIAVIPGAVPGEDPPLLRGTTWPHENFWILPVTLETKSDVLALLSRPDLIAVLSEAYLERAAMHVQIEKDGQIQLGAYDYFDIGSTRTGHGVPEEFLRSLVDSGVLRGYESVGGGVDGQGRPRAGWLRWLLGVRSGGVD